MAMPAMNGIPAEADMKKEAANMPLRYVHPERVGPVSTFLGKVVLSYLFFLALNCITAYTTEVCVIDNAGTVLKGSHCEIQTLDHAGTYPNFKENFGLSVFLVGVAAAVFSFASGAWTRSTYSYEQDLSRAQTAWVVNDVPFAPLNLAISIAVDFAMAFAAGATSKAFFGGTRYDVDQDVPFYKVSSSAVGGPAMSLSATDQTYGTVVVVVLISYLLKQLALNWIHYNTQWTVLEAGQHALDMNIQVLRAFMIGLTQMVVSALQAPFIGAATGYMVRDLANLALTESGKGQVEIDEESGKVNMYVITLLWPIISIVAAGCVFYAMLWSVKIGNSRADFVNQSFRHPSAMVGGWSWF